MSVLRVPAAGEPLMLKLTQQVLGGEDAEFGREHRERMMNAALKKFAVYLNRMTAEGSVNNPR